MVKSYSIRIEDKVYRQFKALAKKNGVKLSYLIERTLDAAIQQAKQAEAA